MLKRILTVAFAIGLTLSAVPAHAETAAKLDANATAALKRLLKEVPSAKIVNEKAKAVLIFPRMVKAGFMVGGQFGEGVLRRGNKTLGYYNSVAGSYGLQAGAQSFGYALFFMNDAALAALDSTAGFEVGAGPSLVIIDKGKAKSITTTTLTQDVYAFIFGQKGLMGGLGLQGSKITKISK